MASAIIHLAVAKEIEPYINIKNKKDYYLGSIAPDMSKHVGKKKNMSHFLIPNTEIPDIEKFKIKYPKFYQNDFDLGYYIHLFTDKIWTEDFLPKLIKNNSVKLKNGNKINLSKEELKKLIYQDYTNLNIKVIEKYNMDLSLFYEDFQIPNTKINEVPIDKLNILIDKMGIIIENSKQEKLYIFDTTLIYNFIEEVVEKLIEEIKDYELSYS